MGTKITQKSIGHTLKGDNKWVTKALEKDRKVANSEKELRKLLKNPNLYFIELGKKDLYAVNKLKYKNKAFLLPEGNPVTYYYSLAYDILPQIDEARNLLLDSLKGEGSKYKWKTLVAFSYIFKVGANCILFSFLAVEAFMNQCLPDYVKIEFQGKLVDKNKIQRYLEFKAKFENIIPTITKKQFTNDHPIKAQILTNLKILRDELIHLKENRKDGISSYEDINNKILNIDLRKMVNTVKFYINYHSPKTIQNYKRRPAKKAKKILFQELGEDNKGKYVKYYYEDNNVK